MFTSFGIVDGLTTRKRHSLLKKVRLAVYRVICVIVSLLVCFDAITPCDELGVSYETVFNGKMLVRLIAMRVENTVSVLSNIRHYIDMYTGRKSVSFYTQDMQ